MRSRREAIELGRAPGDYPFKFSEQTALGKRSWEGSPGNENEVDDEEANTISVTKKEKIEEADST